MKMCCHRCAVEWMSPAATTCWACGRHGDVGFLRNGVPAASGLRTTRLAGTIEERERPFVKGDEDVAAQVTE